MKKPFKHIFDKEPMPKAWLQPLIYHPTQEKLMTDDFRFKVIPAGRRSGKTFLFKRHVVKQFMLKPGTYFAAAPTYGHAKRLFWQDLNALIPKWFIRDVMKGELIIYGINGSELHVLGLDVPARFEGIPWTGGGVDEIADCKNDIWGAHLRPAFDTIGLNTWCWLFGVPDGLNHFYDLAMKAQSDKTGEWGYYHWTSEEILPAKTITNAKADLSPKQYRQEYLASFETASGRVYEDYGKENLCNEIFDEKNPELIWTHDFNFTPLSSAIIQRKDNKIHVIDEIVLNSAVARQTANEFCERYKGYRGIVKIYGDASGHKGEKHGHPSDYIEIEKILRANNFRVSMNVPRSDPAIKDGQNSLRALILNAVNERRLFVNPKCTYVNKGLSTVQLQVGSTFQEKDSEYQHITTALRYFTAVEYPVHKGKSQAIRIQ